MLRNYWKAALGDLRRHPGQSAIAIGGLSIGLMAAIAAGICIVSLFTYNHFVPGYDRIFYAIVEFHDAKGDQYSQSSPRELAGYLKSFPEVEKVARLNGSPQVLRNGDISARLTVNWADPDFFRIYQAPVAYGDLATALDKPDGMVLTRGAARQFFGRENVIGETLEMNHGHNFRIAAIIEDWPLNASTYRATAFASSLASFSVMNESTPGLTSGGAMNSRVATLIRLAPGTSLGTLNARATALISRFVPKSSPFRRAMHFERIDRLVVSPKLNPDLLPRVTMIASVALIILGLACINFINLAVARSAQRGLEVGIRKATGAKRSALIVQFLSETILQVMLALILAAAVVELFLPNINAFMNSGATFDYWRNPDLLGGLLLAVFLVGVLAGSYPAFILSSFRPAQVLKGLYSAPGSERLRQILVALQFSAMIVFLISATVVLRQNRYVNTEAMRVPVDQTVLVTLPECKAGFKDRIATLPGVKGAACAGMLTLAQGNSSMTVVPKGGGAGLQISLVPVSAGYFELYGLKPIAGRFFRDDNGDDVKRDQALGRTTRYVVDETAVRQLGYKTAQEAIGKPVMFLGGTIGGTIIGVVKTFSLTVTGAREMPPAIYTAGTPASANMWSDLLHVKLTGTQIPETLAAIDAEWKKSGGIGPISRQFLDTNIQAQQEYILREGQMFAMLSGVAMLLSCLGLFGITIATAVKRTKEIGVRKAMGASTLSVVALLLWQFAKPVLWANVIAWPLAFWAMNRWLNGFATHVDLEAGAFIAASAVALAVALVTVAGQAVMLARRAPVLALRYE